MTASRLAARCTAPTLPGWVALGTLLIGLANHHWAVADVHAYATNQEDNTVSVINADTLQVEKTLNVGDQPAGVSAMPSGELVFVANPGDNSVTIIDGVAQRVIRSVPIDGTPLALLASQTALYVADWHGNRILVFDLPAVSLRGSIPTGKAPSGLAFNGDGSLLLVALRDEDALVALSLSTWQEVARSSTGHRPFGIAMDHARQRVFVANVQDNSISVHGLPELTRQADIPVGERPYAISFAQRYTRAFVSNQYDNTVSVIATDSLEVVKTLDVGEYPEGIDTHPDDQTVYVANWFDNSVSIVDSARLEVTTTIDTGDGTRAYGNFFVTTP